MLRLLRLPNLLILALTIYLVAHYVIYPPIIDHQITSFLTGKDLYLIVFIALCIGAGGYVYNDIVDQGSDSSNDKRKTVGHSITRKFALLLYVFLTLAPLPFMLGLTMDLGRSDYLVYYFLIVLVLWVYNQYLKRMPLLGNIAIALLCTLAILLPYLLEIRSLEQVRLIDITSHREVCIYVYGFSTFTFLANLIREIIKDVEDIEGDLAMGYRTLPIVINRQMSRYTILGLSILLLIVIIIWVVYFLDLSLTKVRIGLILLIPPLPYIIYKTSRAQLKEDYTRLSLSWKYYFIMSLVSLIIIVN